MITNVTVSRCIKIDVMLKLFRKFVIAGKRTDARIKMNTTLLSFLLRLPSSDLKINFSNHHHLGY